MKAGEMSLCWGCECHQTAHQAGCAQGESDSAFRSVLVELVGELAKTALCDGPARAVPAQALEADSVVCVHGGVSMQRKPIGDGQPLPTVTRRRHLKRQACLNGLLLEPLEVVLWPGLLQLAPVGTGLAQRAVENFGHLVVARGLELDALAEARVVAP